MLVYKSRPETNKLKDVSKGSTYSMLQHPYSDACSCYCSSCACGPWHGLGNYIDSLFRIKSKGNFL